MYFSTVEQDVLISAAGWYDFNWYDKATNNLVYYLHRWKCDKSKYWTTKICTTLEIIKKHYPHIENDEFDFGYDTLHMATKMFKKHLESLSVI